MLVAVLVAVATATTTTSVTPTATVAATTKPATTTVIIAHRCRARDADVARLQPLLALLHLILDFISFVQALEPLPSDSGEMNKHICSAVILLDEAKAFFSVEPLDFSRRHLVILDLPP